MFRGQGNGWNRVNHAFARSSVIVGLLLGVLIFVSLASVSQTWPRCISGCTANDVELLAVTAEVLGPPDPDGIVEVSLWGALHFNRRKSYCVRFVADVYVDGAPTAGTLVTEPINVLSKGAYPALYLGTVSVPGGSVLSLETVKIMWSVDNKLDPASKCQGCEDYGPGSKCTGDQFGSIVVPLPLDAVNDVAEIQEDASVTTDVLLNDTLGSLPTEITAVSDGAHGTTTSNGDGTITYTPDPDFFGTDTYTYTIEDNDGSADSAVVSVTVFPVSDPPIAGDDGATTEENNYVNIDVTANDSDPDGAIDKSTVSIVSNPGLGEISVDPATGVVTYTPEPGACGSDGFTYRVDDFDGTTSNEATVTIDVVCNEPPAAHEDFASTDENTSIGINVTSNDSDGDGTIDPASVTITADPDLGELSVHPSTGAVTYTPVPGACGLDSFRYTVDDDDGATSNEATVTIDVMCDDPPLAIDDLYTTAEGETLEVPEPGILANDVTSQWEPLSAVLVSDISHGTLSLEPDGSFVYVHDGGETTSDSFTYLANDGTDDSNVATVNIVVTPTNDDPSAEDDEDTTDEDTPVTIDVLTNDSDPDGDPLSVDWIASPSHGEAINNGNNITYIPDPNFHGVDTFTYAATDGHGGSATAIVEVTVAAVNDPPMAQNDSAGTDEDNPVDIDVLLNDRDPDGDGFSIQSVTQADNGTVTHGGSEVTYTPDPEFHGVDNFTYTIADGSGGTSTATVTVTIAPVNDHPSARDDQADTDEDTPIAIDVLRNDGDPDGDSLHVEAVSQPANGSVVNSGTDVTYTPDPGFNGSDAFTYTISDSNGGTDTATVQVTTDPVNDDPIAQDDSDATDEDVPVTIDVLGNDSDPDGDGLIVQSVTQPAHGSVANNGVNITYTPDPGFNGSDAFTYTVSDGNGGTDTSTVTIAVAMVNDAPIAADDSDTTDEDVPVTIDILDNDSDPDGDSLFVQSVTQPASGSVANSGTAITYTPDRDFFGVDSFTYILSDDNGGTDIAIVEVTIEPVNDPPIAQDDSDSTDENVSVTINGLDNDSDPDGDNLTVQSVTQPANGSVENSGTDFTYTPDKGFSGTDTFTYTVSDGHGGSATATVSVAVALVNEPPEAVDDDAITLEDTPVAIPILANDRDPDGDDLVVESVTQPVHGTVAPSGVSAVYTPSHGFGGTDTFAYTIADGHGGTAAATVNVTVLETNDPPRAQDDSGTTSEGSALTIPVLLNDADPDGDDLLVESVAQPVHGATVNNGVDVTYTPDPGFGGTDTFLYTVSDGKGKTDTATVIVTVVSVNSSPLAQDDSATTTEGTMVLIRVLANDSDPDGDFLLVESFGRPINGTVLNARTGVSYIPDPGFQGIDRFTYRISDGNGGTSSATVTVSVAGVNDPPLARDDNVVTDEGLTVTVLVLLNDSDPDGDALVVESVTQGKNGTVSNNGTDVSYMPVEGFSGVDVFTYTVSDGNGGTDTATVFVAVAPVNDPPVAQDDSTTTERDTAIVVPVLLNDSDPDADPLAIDAVTQPENGEVAITGFYVTYTPNRGFTGTDTFAYTVSDGRGNTDTATVIIGVSGEAGAGGAFEGTACNGKIIISEVAWAGTAADSKDEWIELRNIGTTSVTLDGWELRWRRSHPSTPEEQIWKVVKLSGVLRPSSAQLCDQAAPAIEPTVRFFQDDPADVEWFLSSEIEDLETGFYVLERRHDGAISDLDADLLYDTSQALNLELSDLGEVIMLVDDLGEIVDTANASNLGRDGWAAGSAATYGTMERIDPLGADSAENWHTNMGIAIRGKDSRGHLLRATPGGVNSPVFQDLSAYTSIKPSTVRAGEVLQVEFPLQRQDRRASGWPWISVSRPGFVGATGAGGAADLAGYAFSGQYEGAERYILDIDTRNLPPGTYVFWVIYGQGKAILIPIVVAP